MILEQVLAYWRRRVPSVTFTVVDPRGYEDPTAYDRDGTSELVERYDCEVLAFRCRPDLGTTTPDGPSLTLPDAYRNFRAARSRNRVGPLRPPRAT